MKFQELAKILKAPLDLKGEISKFCFDSREACPGSVFFAIKGEKVDGHQFISNVEKSGAKLAIIDSEIDSKIKLPTIRVKSVKLALQHLAKEYLATSKAEVIAITGSLGKTTTKCFVETMLRKEFTVSSTIKSYNSQLGLPLSVLNMDLNVDKIVLEMGMDKPGNISRLIEIAPPDIAALIGVDFVHIGNFSGLEGVALAKAEIFKHPKTKKGLLFDQVPLRKEIKKVGVCKKKIFSVCDRKACYYLESGDRHLKVYENGNVHEIPWVIAGMHNTKNFLAAIGICRMAGLSWKAIEEVSLDLTLPSRRFQVQIRNDITFINDTYNACLSSVKAALDTMPLPGKAGKTYLVFGEMSDLGPYSHVSHEEVGKVTVQKKIADVLCLGSECRVIEAVRRENGQSTHIFTTKEEIKKHMEGLLKPGDVILFKGSNKHALWELEEELRGEY